MALRGERMVRASKKLGQHFLRDPSVVQRAVDALELTGQETVLEIGPGHGVLTEALAAKAGRVVAIELDRGLAASLQATMPDNVEVVHGDALRVDLDPLGPFDHLAGNLPYQISSPLTFRLLDVPFRRAVFLYQLEFAERLAADGPDDAAYGRLSVTRAARASARLIRKVKPGAFVPVPRVMSGLVLLERFDAPPFDTGGDMVFFDDVVRELFTQRRKTLRKALLNQAPTLGLGKASPEQVDAWLAEADVVDVRVEQLDPPGYGRLVGILRASREAGA